MDIPSIAAAIGAVKALKDILQDMAKLKVDTETQTRLNDAQHQVSEILGALLQTQGDLFKLLQEAQALRDQLKAYDDWEKRRLAYQLQQTAGGATVYASTTSPAHYACPRCMERREVQILQDRGVVSGLFDCPACKAGYYVKPRKEISVKTNFDPRVS